MTPNESEEQIEFKKDSRVAEYREYLTAWFLFNHFLMSFKKSLTTTKTMNRESPKILTMLIAISFILQIALPGHIFAQGASAEVEQNSEEHNLSGNYDWGYGADYDEAIGYYDDFGGFYGDYGGYADDWGDYEYDYYDSGYGGEGDWDYGGDYYDMDYYGASDYGSDQAGSDYYDWGDYAYDWENDLGWEDLGYEDYYDDPWGDAWDDSYDSLSQVPVGTTDLAPDAFSLPIDDKSQFIKSMAGGDTPGIGIGIDDTESLGDWQNSLQVAQDAVPYIDAGLRDMGEAESAQEFIRNLGIEY